MAFKCRHGESKEDFKKRCSDAGRLGAEAKFAKESEGRGIARAPGRYTKLYRIRVENLVTGSEQEIFLMRGDRLNNYFVSCFGRVSSKALGMHKILSKLAERMVIRWIEY